MVVTARQPGVAQQSEVAELVGPVEAPVQSAMVVTARQLGVARQPQVAELVGSVEAPVLSAMVVTGVWKAVP